MTVLITGGAGYIGSHVLNQFSENRIKAVVLDNLSTGSRKALLHNETLEICDLSDEEAVSEVIAKHKIDSVLHFAASISVTESVTNPIKYYTNNTENTIKLIRGCLKHKVQNFIFSSTAAVYGNVPSGIAFENTPTNPISPYGQSKLMSERILTDAANASRMNFVILRYFNVAGADPEGRLGQRSQGDCHLIKACINTALGKQKVLKIFGDDYDTPDGSGIRDFIHVVDLASAHLEAYKYLMTGGKSQILNVGYNHKHSVKEVVTISKQVTGVDFHVEVAKRREGDIPQLIANVDAIKATLNWQPKYADLRQIIRDTWQWENKLMNGQV